jgi:hypothetical protein
LDRDFTFDFDRVRVVDTPTSVVMLPGGGLLELRFAIVDLKTQNGAIEKK